MSFVILLPDSKTGLGNLEGKLCGKGHEKVFTKLDESLVNKGVNIAIPKLVLEMEYSDMDKHLKKVRFCPPSQYLFLMLSITDRSRLSFRSEEVHPRRRHIGHPRPPFLHFQSNP